MWERSWAHSERRCNELQKFQPFVEQFCGFLFAAAAAAALSSG